MYWNIGWGCSLLFLYESMWKTTWWKADGGSHWQPCKGCDTTVIIILFWLASDWRRIGVKPYRSPSVFREVNKRAVAINDPIAMMSLSSIKKERSQTRNKKIIIKKLSLKIVPNKYVNTSSASWMSMWHNIIKKINQINHIAFWSSSSFYWVNYLFSQCVCKNSKLRPKGRNYCFRNPLYIFLVFALFVRKLFIMHA